MQDDPPHRTPGPSWSRPMTESRLEPAAHRAPPAAAGGDDATRAGVTRLARRPSSGGTVLRRAAILAEGADSARVVAWVVAHGGRPEAAVASPARGLHSPRLDAAPGAVRYVLPAGALA